MKKLFIELADTSVKREYGLKNRKYLASNSGMLFKFPRDEYLSFWMQSTYVPLDIAFVDSSGKILQIEEMYPLSTRSVRSNHKCKYALEVNKGWFKNNDIKVGNIIGGEGLENKKIFAQNVKNEIPTNQPEQPGQIEQPGSEQTDEIDKLQQLVDGQDQNQEKQNKPVPDVMLNRSYKDIFDDADKKGKDLMVIYQTKEGLTLPPKLVSPPYRFLHDENGKANAIVNLWDNQTAGWKSFIIDNILDIKEKINYQEENVEGNMY